MDKPFKIHSKFQPTGDQPQAIEKIADGFQNGLKFQTLGGVTGFRENLYHGKRH